MCQAALIVLQEFLGRFGQLHCSSALWDVLEGSEEYAGEDQHFCLLCWEDPQQGDLLKGGSWGDHEQEALLGGGDQEQEALLGGRDHEQEALLGGGDHEQDGLLGG